jgi:hypothetical protein
MERSNAYCHVWQATRYGKPDDSMFAAACQAPNSTPQIASQLITIFRIVFRLAVEMSWNA